MNQSILNPKDLYENIMTKADPRVADFFLMDNPMPSIVICIFYFILVLYILPNYMRSRAPFEIRSFLIIYNFLMVLLSAYIFTEFGLVGWFGKYSFGCQPVDYSMKPEALRMANASWWFFFSKFIELLDTIFFILRKKFKQVTFLHVFHHGIMPVSWWFGVKFVPGGFGTFHAWLNSFIHFLMYTYYGLASLGPSYQRFIWWKKYMTSLQITQFILVCLHSSQLLFIQCPYPIVFTYWIGSYAIIFLFLFINFYLQAYKQDPFKKSFSHMTQNLKLK